MIAFYLFIFIYFEFLKNELIHAKSIKHLHLRKHVCRNFALAVERITQHKLWTGVWKLAILPFLSYRAKDILTLNWITELSARYRLPTCPINLNLKLVCHCYCPMKLNIRSGSAVNRHKCGLFFVQSLTTSSFCIETQRFIEQFEEEEEEKPTVESESYIADLFSIGNAMNSCTVK